MTFRNRLPLLGGEGSPQGWVRGCKPLINKALANQEPLIRPSGTFSLWEKGSDGDLV